jgi:hypothetical protein
LALHRGFGTLARSGADAGRRPDADRPAANNEPFAALFRDALAARGYVEGRDVRLDYRFPMATPSDIRKWRKPS